MTSEPARIEAWKRRLDGWEQYKNAKPNVGHYFIQALSLKEKLIGLITQNVDGLHSMAGLPDDQIVELHGSNRKILCMSCSQGVRTGTDHQSVLSAISLRPSAIAAAVSSNRQRFPFGQAMPEQAMRIAQEWTEQAEIFIVMGSSLQVQPAASFPVWRKRNGALLAIINREAGPLDDSADFVHNGSHRRVLRQIRRDDRRWMTIRNVGRKERKKRKVKTRKFTTKDTKITKVGKVIIRTLRVLRELRGETTETSWRRKGKFMADWKMIDADGHIREVESDVYEYLPDYYQSAARGGDVFPATAASWLAPAGGPGGHRRVILDSHVGRIGSRRWI